MNKPTFIGINLVLSSGILMLPIVNLIIWLFFTDINSTWMKYIPPNSLLEILVLLGIPLALTALFWFFKIFLFFLIDKFSKKDSFSYKVFYNMRTDKNFRKKALIYAFLSDMIFVLVQSIFLSYNFNESYFKTIHTMFLYWLIFGMGVFLCYLSYAHWAKRQHEKEAPDSEK